MSPQQMNVYQLAENLGLTVTRMSREMTMSEFMGWSAFYAARAEEMEREAKGKKKSQKGRGVSGDVVLRGFDL